MVAHESSSDVPQDFAKRLKEVEALESYATWWLHRRGGRSYYGGLFDV